MSERPAKHIGPPTEYSDGAENPAGTGRTVAYALAVLGVDVVQRGTLRALLPKGQVKLAGPVTRQRKLNGENVSISKNKTSIAFKDALARYERWGWIQRTPELVYVRDREALLKHALQGQEDIPKRFLNIEGALNAVRWEHEAAVRTAGDGLYEQRRREIKALLALMQAPVTGANRSGTRSVRIVNKSQVI